MRLLNKCVAYFYILCRALIPHREGSGSDRILIVDGGHIGDIIFDASAWNAIIERSVSQGKEVFILTTGEAWNTLRRFLKTDRVQFVECSKELCNLKALKDVFLKLKGLNFEAIVERPHCIRWINLLAVAIPAEKRYVVLEKELIRTSLSNTLYRVLHGRYTGVIIEDENSGEKDAIEELMRVLGYNDYHMQIPPLPCQGEVPMPAGHYITIALDSQNTARRWPEERFIQLIEELLKKFDDDIILTGSFLEDAAARRYEEAFRGNARVRNMVGKLPFDQWIELLRGAHFHIGVDSGSIHVAAAVGTTAFCLTGFWHLRRFFPYHADMIGLETAMPICVYRTDVELQELDCSGCACRGPYGKGNRTCQEQIRAGKPCLCLQAIRVDDVTAAVDNVLNSGTI